jgi:hypothetical protein
MTTARFFGTAAALVVAMASAVAQDATQAPGVNAQTYPWATDGRGAAGNGGGAAGVTAPARGPESFVSYDVGRNNDNTYALYYGDRPVSRRTTCGLQSDATYMGPDGRWYPC